MNLHYMLVPTHNNNNNNNNSLLLFPPNQIEKRNTKSSLRGNGHPFISVHQVMNMGQIHNEFVPRSTSWLLGCPEVMNVDEQIDDDVVPRSYEVLLRSNRKHSVKFIGARELLRTLFAGNSCMRNMYTVRSISRKGETLWRSRFISSQGSLKLVQRAYRISPSGASMENREIPSNLLRDKKMVPSSDPPRVQDIDLLHQFFERSSKLVILTGAGISTESGIPDYRSPNGAYSTGFRPMTHQEFLRSSRARRRYWARSYAGWRRFNAAQPGPAHIALASLEKAGRVHCMMTQNVDRLHHRAGSNPLELHGTVYIVGCTDCGASVPRSSFQDQVKDLNLKWAEAIESLDYDSRADKSFGMNQRPDGDIEIDEKFWEEEFHIPNCHKCNGILKPDVVFFGDNVPKGRADRAMEAAKECDAFLALGSSLMTFSAFRLIRAAHEAGAATAIVNIGVTRADDFVPLKINARLGEILPRLLSVGSLSVPSA